MQLASLRSSIARQDGPKARNVHMNIPIQKIVTCHSAYIEMITISIIKVNVYEVSTEYSIYNFMLMLISCQLRWLGLGCVCLVARIS